MADLEQELARTGIEPIGVEWKPPVYSVFRTVEREPADEDVGPSEDSEDEQAIVVGETGVDKIEEASPPPFAIPTPAAEEVLAINDRFIMAYMDEPTRQFCLTMTASDHRPEVGLVAANHMIFRQFLGAGEEEQIDIDIDGKRREAVILKIDKAPEVYRQIASTAA